MISLGRYDEPTSTQVYLSTWPRKNCAAVRALLADDLGALDEARVVDEQRAAFAADDVLGLVEAERAELADRAERPAAVGREDALRGVLDDQQCRGVPRSP